MSYLHKLTMEQVLIEYEKLDEGGTNLAVMRALCLDDLWYLLTRICSVGKVKNKDGQFILQHPWIYARCREFEANPDGYIDLWAREHFKTTIITFGGTIQAILRDPEITIGIFGESNDIAGKNFASIKAELETNVILKKLFPDILYEKPYSEAPIWNQSAITVKRKAHSTKEPTLEASGLGSHPVGRHYQMLVYDDVVTMDSVSTREQIEKTTNLFELSLSLGKEGGVKRIIGTRYNLADTYDTILKRGTAIPRIYPATDDGTIDGKPVMLSEAYWKTIVRDVSSSNLCCQYLQNPAQGLEKMFDVEDLMFYEVRPYTLNVYLMVDPANSMKQGSDKTAMAVIGVDANGNKYLLDGVNHQMKLSDRWLWMRRLYFRWKKKPGVKFVKVGYETYGAGNVDVNYFEEMMKNASQSERFTIHEMKAPKSGGKSKIDRVGRLEPDIRSGAFFLPRPTSRDNKNLTKMQQDALKAGQEDRISRRILQKTVDGEIYDLSKELYDQINYFPKGKVDLIDAVSRIYDLEPVPPYPEVDRSLLEPEYI